MLDQSRGSFLVMGELLRESIAKFTTTNIIYHSYSGVSSPLTQKKKVSLVQDQILLVSSIFASNACDLVIKYLYN